MKQPFANADCRLPNEGGALRRDAGTRGRGDAERRRGFTLIEMMVVITIIVLAMTLAVPAIRSLTGSRSQEAAQNVLTTALGAARAEAMAMQRVEGIMFFLDTSSDRIMCAEVMETSQQPTDNLRVQLYLDLVPDKDPLYLPTGIWLWTMKDLPAVATFGSNADAFDQSRYLGFNFYNGSFAGQFDNQTPAPVIVPGGVILFDATGRLTVRTYGLRMTSGTPSAPTQMATFLFPNLQPGAITVTSWPAQGATTQWCLQSQIGLCLFDRETFLAATSGTTQYTPYNSAGIVTDVNKWLDTNTTPIFVNRYDATLMRAE